MTAADRRLEIISILVVSGHTTSKELAQEFGVTRRTILHDVSVLSYGYPVYTKQGEGGGIFIMDSYKPYNNTLTPIEQERLKKMYDAAEGEDKKILGRVLRKYVHIRNCRKISDADCAGYFSDSTAQKASP